MAVVGIIQSHVSGRAIVHSCCIIGQILVRRSGIPAGGLVRKIIVECVDVQVAHVGQDSNICVCAPHQEGFITLEELKSLYFSSFNNIEAVTTNPNTFSTSNSIIY